MTDHVIRSLDGAHRDYAESGDAMRWKPPHACDQDEPCAVCAPGIPTPRTGQQ